MNATAPLRIVQVSCVLLVLACLWLSRLGHREWQRSLAPRHWIVIAAAIWTTISGFTLQRRIVNRPANPRRPSKSTPFTRWRAGHIFRLWTAMSVGLWALLLGEYAGPPMIVNALFVLSLLLLLLRMPGPRPDKASLSSLNGIGAGWFVCYASVPAVPEIFPTPWLHRVVAWAADSRSQFPN